MNIIIFLTKLLVKALLVWVLIYMIIWFYYLDFKSQYFFVLCFALFFNVIMVLGSWGGKNGEKKEKNLGC